MLCNVLKQLWVADSGTTLNGGRRFQVIIRKTCQWPIVGECHVSCTLQSSVEFVSFHDFSYGLWDCSENVVFFLYFTTEYVYCSRYNRLNDPLAFLPSIFPVAYRSRCPGYFIPLFCIGLYIVEVVPILNMHDEVVIAGG